ncbi:hypothetical protein [Endozoicomonas atrinae]|uniref:hypothetical protein n=1 Tax=Endozoicomonas atrinae TaxID=1333660 RepID=UPI003B00E0C6
MGIGQALGQIYSAIYFSASVTKMRGGIHRLKYLVSDISYSFNEYKNNSLNQKNINKADKVENRVNKTPKHEVFQEEDSTVNTGRPLPPGVMIISGV